MQFYLRFFHFRLKLLFGIFTFFAFAAPCFGQTIVKNQTPLVLNVPVESDFAAGEMRTFTLHLEKNQFAALILEQPGVDLKIALDDAENGSRLLEIDFNAGGFGQERLLWTNTASRREVLVRVFSARQNKSSSGKFSLTLVELKSADERDQKRIAAQQSMTNAVKLLSEDKKELKRQGFSQLENSLKIARESRDSLLEATASGFLQAASINSGDAHKSVEFGKAAIVLLAGRENAYRRAAINESNGAALVMMGEYEKGIEVLSEVLAQTEEFGEDSLNVNVLLDLSYGYLFSNDAPKSLEYADRAWQTAVKIGDEKSQIKALITLTEIYVDRDESAKILETANRVLSLGKESGIAPASVFSNIYTNISIAYNNLGQMQKSLEYDQQALDFARNSTGNKFDEATCLVNLAKTYFNLGQNTRSMNYTRQAIRLLDTLPYKSATRMNLDLQNGIEMGVGDYEKAKITVTAALKLAREDQPVDLVRVRNSYFTLGYIENILGRHETALDSYLESYKVGTALNTKKSELRTLIRISDVYISLKRMEKAGQTAAESLETARAVGDRAAESNALYNLARVRRSQQDLNAARHLIEDSLKIVESTRSELIGREDRTAFLSTVRDQYDFYISLLIEMQHQPENKLFGAAAFAVSEKARARGLLDLLAESDTRISAGISPELKERERRIYAKLAALQTNLIQLKSAEKPDAKRIGEVQEDIRKVDEEREQAETEIKQANPRYAELKYPTTIDLAQTQKMLDDKTVLLEYQIGADASFLFAVGKNEFQIIELPDEKTLRNAVETLHKSLSTPSRGGLGNYLMTGRELYQTLIAPVENLLKTKSKIIVAADGALHYLPFETLLKNNQAASLDKLPYLVRDFDISYTPSASVLANLKSYESSVAKPHKSFLAFAAPDYDAKTANRNQLVNQNTRSIFNENRGWDLTDLQFAKTEATSIAKLFPAGQADVYTGAQATEERVKSAEFLSQYRYLHFAVHGLIDEEQPQFSSLVLSLPKDDQSAVRNPKSEVEEDGLLQTPEIFNLRLRADLVTLSACETGLGQEMRGEGMVGLTRAFFYAGTPSVLVSLWKVDDASTAELMTSFYENLQKTDGRDKSAALRETQLKMIAENRYAHPFYWASFILQGKPNSPAVNR